MVSKQYIFSVKRDGCVFLVTYTVCSSKLRGTWDQSFRSSHRSRAEKTSRQHHYCGSSHFQMMLNEFAWEKQSATKFHIIYAGLWKDHILHLADRGRKRGKRQSWGWLRSSGEKKRWIYQKNKKVKKHIWTNRGEGWGERNTGLRRERPKVSGRKEAREWRMDGQNAGWEREGCSRLPVYVILSPLFFFFMCHLALLSSSSHH